MFLSYFWIIIARHNARAHKLVTRFFCCLPGLKLTRYYSDFTEKIWIIIVHENIYYRRKCKLQRICETAADECRCKRLIAATCKTC